MISKFRSAIFFVFLIFFMTDWNWMSPTKHPETALGKIPFQFWFRYVDVLQKFYAPQNNMVFIIIIIKIKQLLQVCILFFLLDEVKLFWRFCVLGNQFKLGYLTSPTIVSVCNLYLRKNIVWSFSNIYKSLLFRISFSFKVNLLSIYTFKYVLYRRKMFFYSLEIGLTNNPTKTFLNFSQAFVRGMSFSFWMFFHVFHEKMTNSTN